MSFIVGGEGVESAAAAGARAAICVCPCVQLQCTSLHDSQWDDYRMGPLL